MHGKFLAEGGTFLEACLKPIDYIAGSPEHKLLRPPPDTCKLPSSRSEWCCAGASAGKAVKRMLPRVASLYKGVVGAASGAGIYIGTYFAFYGAACNVLSRRTDLSPGGVAFVAGGIAAAGGSVVKVPLAVCIRSVQVPMFFCKDNKETCKLWAMRVTVRVLV